MPQGVKGASFLRLQTNFHDSLKAMDRAIFYSVFALMFFPRETYLTFYPTVFWTPTNCRFKLNKPNEKGYSIKIKYMSNMIFMCPHVSIWAGISNMMPDRRMMNENVLLVNEESYKSCSIGNRTQVKELLTCDEDPMGSSVKYSLEKFARNQADPDKHCYDTGQHYYFISTSSGSVESLNNTEGGHCKTHHMKLHIYVCNDTEPCEFEMPECPKEKARQQNNDTSSNSKCTNDSVSTAAQTGVKGWFSDNRHPVLYAVMGLFIVILIVIIFWLLHINRKYRKSGATITKKNEQKSSVEKELIRC